MRHASRYAPAPMQKIRARIAIIVCLSVGFAALSVASAQTRAPWAVSVESPTFAPGDSWRIRYSNGVRSVRKFVKEQAGTLFFDIEHSWPTGNKMAGALELNRDLSIVRMLGPDGAETRRFEPQSLGLRFPLEVGKRWEEECRRYDRGQLVGIFKGQYTVAAREEITTPAGRFDTFRVEGQTFEVADPALRWRFTHWYAPAVGMEVRVESVEPNGTGTVFELVEHRPAASAATAFQGAEKFVGRWEGHWKEVLLAIAVTVEAVNGRTAAIRYWRGASRFPAFQAPSEQRSEGRFIDAATLCFDVWDDSTGDWADLTFTLNRDGTLNGKWRRGEFVQSAILQKQP